MPSWFTESNFTDWVQAGGSIASVFVAYVALRVAKTSMNAGVTTLLKPIDIVINPNFNSLTIRVSNIGPGMAYDVEVSSYTIERNGNFHSELVKRILIGSNYIKPLEAEEYNVQNDLVIRLGSKSPVILKFKLASGTTLKTYWKFNGDRKVSPDRFVQLSKWKFYQYKLNRVFRKKSLLK